MEPSTRALFFTDRFESPINLHVRCFHVITIEQNAIALNKNISITFQMDTSIDTVLDLQGLLQ